MRRAVPLRRVLRPRPVHTPVSLRIRPLTSLGPTSGVADVNELNFDDIQKSFSVKTDWELARALLVFKLCSYPVFVQNANLLLNVSRRILGDKAWAFLLKKTFFGHFCAGESADDIQPTIKRLEQSGLRAVLDYAAEADVPEPQKRDREGIVSARTYDYEGEAECDANAQICLSCIETAGRQSDGFAAIKLTALGKPQLLEHLSKVLTETTRLFRDFSVKSLHRPVPMPPRPGAPPANEDPLRYLCRRISFEDFAAGIQAIHLDLGGEEKARELFDQMDTDKSGEIDFFEWITFLEPRLLGGLNPHFKGRGLPTLSDEEVKQLDAMLSRLERLADSAAKHKVRLMIDAEHTYFQPAIDHLVLHLQRKYNKVFPSIYNTYQCYLKDSYSRLLVDLERARREGFLFAAKAVRGAYMIQERKRAQEMNYPDPIMDTIEDTHANFHRVSTKMLENIDIADIMIASHNESSIRFVVEKMARLKIPKQGGGVFFGQLLGMCDHVSFSLGTNNYQAYKYVPYGPLDEVLPYLVRRAEENSTLLGGATKERKLLWAELCRRRLPAALLPYVTSPPKPEGPRMRYAFH